jgi:hypothetical protein
VSAAPLKGIAMSPSSWYEKILHTLRNWHARRAEGEELLTQSRLVQRRCRQTLQENPSASAHDVIRQLLGQELEKLRLADETGHDILQARFIEGLPVRQIALQLHLSEDSVQRRQRQAVDRLAASLVEQEAALMAEIALEIEGVLPPPTYSHLFGVEAMVRSLADWLTGQGEPWITIVTGIGGIGKTAVVHQAVRDAAPQWSDQHLVWVRCESPTLTGRQSEPGTVYRQLMLVLSEQPHIGAGGFPEAQRDQKVWQVLKSTPHLVVVDNVEEADEAAVLLENLPRFANPSRFLVTARSRPVSTSAAAYVHAVGELSTRDSLALLRHEADAGNIGELGQAQDDQLESVCRIVGGNPLALKITAGLARVMPLSAILTELQEARPGPVEEMYRRIYWQAWRTLSDPARALLPAMLLMAEIGATPEQMQAASRLADRDLWPAIRELTSCSLLETRGTLLERRYGVHRLTASFLQTEIVNWPLEDGRDA